jgi:hypothetical protein
MSHSPGGAPSAANRFGWDYRRLAARMGPPVAPIIDAHAHTGGISACAIYRDAARAFGVERVYSMVRLGDAGPIKDVLGDFVRFIAFPDFRAPDRRRAFTEGFLEDMQAFHDRFGSRIVKLWNAPRLRELTDPADHREFVDFDSPWRIRHAELAERLGMRIMVHVADPDTWFATRYADAARFGTKADQYRGLRVMLDRFKGPWIAAHMGGWPEDLAFLSSLLAAHPNLNLDTSATKWVVREISRHARGAAAEFFERWRGRVLFGSDVVSTDEHLAPRGAGQKAHPMGELADSPQAAFDLYASRFWALRTLFESDYDGESPIADPDLMMVEPGRYGPLSAPRLRGLGLAKDLLRTLYRQAAVAVIGEE